MVLEVPLGFDLKTPEVFDAVWLPGGRPRPRYYKPIRYARLVDGFLLEGL